MSNLKELFEYKNLPKDNNIINDYEIFKDKDLLDNLRTKIVENIIDKNITNEDNLDEFLNNEINKTIEGFDLTNLERSHLYNLIENEINGYGPLTELLKDENITEIMVNSPSEIYIEIDGNLIKDESISFINDAHIVRTIQKLIEPLGRTIDSSSPMVDSRLKDGSRINAVISFLEAAVKSKMNILVCGGTGSGKTTLLNILSSFIPSEERIITIEDAAELKLSQPHVISLETRTTNYERNGEVTIRDLVRNSLRMRPDRIIVGEVRGGEAFDMLQAMNTGHEGSLTTLHANSNIDALHRLETMVLMANIDIPVKAVREYIFNAIDLVINIERLSDGKRKVSAISEVIDFKDDEIVLNDIFKFKQIGITSSKEVDGQFTETKKMPKCLNKIESYGFKDIEKIFK